MGRFAFSSIVSDGLEFLNQKAKFPFELWIMVVLPPISILLHSVTSPPFVRNVLLMDILELIDLVSPVGWKLIWGPLYVILLYSIIISLYEADSGT